ncbi:oligosaccharide flippase family protein [Halalkalicoccus jeotgali]|uniref:Probable transport protein, putative n=1 Tax=Halalkalicoccus jeotgali (strain DSM 18796 / CECT 7217 / JCM 14584 / KCTC 4019 / B3) TaxID=795797 RepID=D8J7W8_HALJB|nr:oligosaccharide flippase family protein [Halalkalicoccus jeotgali]ADJ14081.1 probable transport protein, putative [Halalkalicoccus jeotgali B3]ELY33875.1 putative transport protein [Halalkalicoccus jeotgali B3]
MDLSRSALKVFLAKGGNAVVFFAGITVFARELGASQIGVFFLFQTVLGLTTIVADVGVRGALEKRLSEGQRPDTMLATAMALKLLTVSGAIGVLLLARPYLNGYLGGEYTALLVVALVVQEFADLFIQAVRGELRVGETAIIEFAREAVWVTSGLAFVAAGYGVIGLMYGLVLGSATAACWAFAKLETTVGRPAELSAWSLYDYAKYYFLSSVSGKVYQWMDVAIIGLFLTYADVGAYEVAWEVTLLVLLVSKTLSITLFPQMSQWSSEAAIDRIEAVVPNAIGIALFLSIPAFVGIVVLNYEVLAVIFGSEYTIAAGVLVVLMLEKVFQSVNDVLGSTLRGIDRVDLVARAVVVTIAINLVLNVALVLSIGLLGAAIATTSAAIVQTLLNARYLSQNITLQIPYRLIAWCLVSAAAMGLVVVGVRAALPFGGIALLASCIGAGVASYFLFSFVVPSLRREVVRPGIRMLVSMVRPA